MRVFERHLDSNQSVHVDTDKVVDGGTDKDDPHTGDKLTRVVTKSPAPQLNCVKRNEKANK